MKRETCLELVWRGINKRGGGEIRLGKEGVVVFLDQPINLTVRGKQRHAVALQFRDQKLVYTGGQDNWHETEYEDISSIGSFIPESQTDVHVCLRKRTPARVRRP